jgi:NADPH2:quinone reductase
VVVIGSRGPVEVNPRDAMSRDASIHGMTLFNTPPADRAALHKRLAAELKKGALRPVVGKRFPLDQAAQAHDAVMSPGAMGKIVLIP